MMCWQLGNHWGLKCVWTCECVYHAIRLELIPSRRHSKGDPRSHHLCYDGQYNYSFDARFKQGQTAILIAVREPNNFFTKNEFER